MDFAAERIAAYHEKAASGRIISFTDEAGVQLGWRWTALDSVGVYVPGGLASYPSSVLMNAVPAKIAGVERVCHGRARAEGTIGASCRLCRAESGCR